MKKVLFCWCIATILAFTFVQIFHPGPAVSGIIGLLFGTAGALAGRIWNERSNPYDQL